ncbi:MAG: sulfite exporter TauE/SafE family protein [Candidatus Paceibacterota bacterium]
MKIYTFYIQGMHCASCVVFIESELKKIADIQNVKVNLSKRILEIEGDFGEKSEKEIAQELSGYVKERGYTFSTETQEQKTAWSDFKIAIPIALGFLLLFIILQKLGIVNLITTDSVGFGTAILIGVIASLSTCMAVVGGLVLSMSANFAKEGEKIRPQALFHIGRIVSFFVLGGVIGALGSAFQLNNTGTFVLSLLVGLVMFLLGLNLLDVFSWTKRIQPTLPKHISKRALEIKKINRTLTPLLLGIATFFFPCGFTQSMQLYALSMGNFWTGALIMGSFALGTLPILALLSFTSVRIRSKTISGIFFKTAGLVVIFFALFNIMNSLVLIGFINPFFTL